MSKDVMPSGAGPRTDSLIPEIGLTEIDGEPRARDIEIAERLGYARPRNIRDLIERNRAELEAFGPLAPRRAAQLRTNGAEHDVDEFWLTEEQSLLVAALSKTEKAAAVRAMLIRCFVAWRRGRLVPAGGEVSMLGPEARTVIGGIVKSVLHAQLTNVIPAMVEGAMLEGGHVVSTDYKPALQVLVDKKVPARKRRAFSQKVSARLRRFALETDKPPRLSRETNRYLFHVDTIRDWLAHEGNALIAEHVAAQAGQGVLPFKRG
jgi:hypothetical protein